MIYLIHIVYGILFATRGDGSKFPRWLWLLMCGAIAYGVTADIYDTLAYLWVFAVFGCLPTNALMSCVHGKLPDRADGKLQFMQDWAMMITRRFPNKSAYYDFGIIYAMIRGFWAWPAIIYLDSVPMAFLPLQGLLLFVLGRINQRYAVRVCEFWTGVLI